MKVRRSKGDNSYCGPAALSAITGRPVHEVTAKLRDVTGARAVYGVGEYGMRTVLKSYGKIPVQVLVAYTSLKPKPTLVKILRQLKTRTADEVFLVTLTGHYVVLKGRKIYDNSNPDGVFIRQYAHRRKRVRDIKKIMTDKSTVCTTLRIPGI